MPCTCYIITLAGPSRSSGCRNKIPQTKWLKQQTFISHSVLEAENPKIKGPAYLIPAEGSFLFSSSSKTPKRILDIPGNDPT